MQKPITSLMAVGLLLLAACGTKVELAPITSFEDIAGTIYERQGLGGQGYFHFFEDGTVHLSSNPDLVVDRPDGIFETRFEGTKMFAKHIKGGRRCDDNPDFTYEIHLLENGNLQLVVVEDPCKDRSGFYSVEWAPVP